MTGCEYCGGFDIDGDHVVGVADLLLVSATP